MSNGTILVVDDDPEILDFYRKIFSAPQDAEFDVLGPGESAAAAELECLTFSDPLELIGHYATRLKSGEKLPLCIIDMRMPLMNGLTTALRIRELDPAINIVICTAFSDTSPDELRARLQGGVFFVRKPFVVEEFLLLVHSLVENWNARRDLELTRAQLATQCEKLAQVLEGTRAGTWDWDIPGGAVEINERWAEIVGYSLSEIEPVDINTWTRLCHPGDLVHSGLLLEDVFSRKTPYYDCECRMRHKDGTWVWVRDRGKVTEWSPDGKPLRMAGTHSDITTAKRHQEELAESEKRLQNIIDSASEYIWELDRDGTFTYVSPRAAHVLGRPIAQILGHKLFDLLPDEERAVLPGFFKQQAEKMEPFEDLRHRVLLPDGSVALQKITGQPVVGNDGKLQGFVGMAMDVTEEEKARAQQAHDRERIETFFEVAIDLLCIVDLEGKFVRVSQAWGELLGRSAKSLEGTLFMDNVHPDDVPSTQEVFVQMQEGRPLSGFVNRYRGKSGEWRFIEWRAKLIRGSLFAAARDVTDARAAESALELALERERQAAKIKSRLVSMASHEFRTPLATIRLAADLLATRRDKMDEAGIQRTLQAILNTTDYMTGIVTDVLDLSSITRDGQPEALTDFPLGDFLRQIAGEFHRETSAPPGITFEWDGMPVICAGIPVLLKRAVNNLLDNAVKYSPPGMPVMLRLKQEGESALVLVEDQGIGIPEEDRAFLNDPFFRASNTVSIPGTGLGLAIVAEALQRMGGTLEHTHRPGGGSIFSIRLPLAATAGTGS